MELLPPNEDDDDEGDTVLKQQFDQNSLKIYSLKFTNLNLFKNHTN